MSGSKDTTHTQVFLLSHTIILMQKKENLMMNLDSGDDMFLSTVIDRRRHDLNRLLPVPTFQIQFSGRIYGISQSQCGPLLI